MSKKKAEKIPLPNYTQIPNVLLDEYMSSAPPAEFKVVMAIARATCGWHKTEELLSLTDLQKKTGMARATVSNAVQSALEADIIARTPDGQDYLYRLNISSSEIEPASSNFEPVKNGQASSKLELLASSEIEPVPVQNLNHLIDKERLKKKEKEKEDSLRSSSADKKQQQERAQTELISFELTEERWSWIRTNTPEILHIAEHEITRLVDWCNNPEYPKRKAEGVTESRFHNWMLNARKFYIEHKLPQSKSKPTTSQDRNRAALEEFKREEGLT